MDQEEIKCCDTCKWCEDGHNCLHPKYLAGIPGCREYSRWEIKGEKKETVLVKGDRLGYVIRTID